MIPSGDHSSRSLLHRRVSSWSEVTSSPQDDVFSLPSIDELSRPLLLELEYEDDDDSISLSSLSRRFKLKWKLWLFFLLLVISGVSNVVLAKLQSLPMYNYPTFLNVYANLGYVILCFCYILPTSCFGWFHNSIPRAHLTDMSKKPFLVMGFLDAISGGMQLLATIYLPGTMLVLLPQAAVPLSMLASRVLLRERFTPYQYVGALVVLAGILVVLLPVLTHRHTPKYSCQAVKDEDCTVCDMETSKEDCQSHFVSAATSMFTSNRTDVELFCHWKSRDESLRTDDFLIFVWSMVMVASCVPMVLSSVYKQVALQVQLDPILLNGWVAVFQLLCGIPLAIPAGLASSPRVNPFDLPQNWSQAIGCLFSQTDSIELGCHPDECSQAALWVHLGLLSSAVYTVSTIFVLKYGSASLLYLGLTVIVPLGHLAFSLHSPSSIHPTDVSGLFVLIAGLVLYRFGHDDEVAASSPRSNGAQVDGANNNHNEAGNENADKNGFLEFLREPFMLVGDI